MNKVLKSVLLTAVCVALDVVSNFCKELKKKIMRKIPKVFGM